MARQATPDIFKDALAVSKAIQDDVRLIMGEPGQGGAPVDVDLDLIDDNPYQPRLTYDEAALQELADSIAANGLVQPVSGRRKSDGRYELEQGHRRLRAFRLLRAKGEGEYQRIPMFVRQVADFDLAMRAWAENHDREGITAIEEAQWIQRMMTDFDLSQAVIAKRLGKSAATVANKLRLLRAPENVRALVVAGSITERQVSAMMPFYDLPEEAQGRTGGHYYNINEILRGAQTGASSDSIRRNVDALVEMSTRDVEDAPWAAVDLGIDGAQSALCTTCSRRVVRNGKDRCPILACYQAKASAWNGRALAEIVAATGIPAAPDRGYMKYNEFQQFYGDDRRIAQEHGFAKPPICDRLRVRSSSDGLQAEGTTNVEIICVHGANGKCGCLAKIRSELMKDGKARWKRFRAQTQEALTEALSAPTPDTLRLIVGHLASWDKRDQVASLTVEEVVATIVDALIKSAMPYDVEKKSDAGEKAMTDLLARAFITPPWSMMATLAPEPDDLPYYLNSSLIKVGHIELPESDDSDDETPKPLRNAPRGYEHLPRMSWPKQNGYIEPTVDREAPAYVDDKLQRIAGWIADFQDPGDGLPTPESVAGNFVNLEKLLETIITQPSEEDQLKLKQLYDHVYASLAALSDRVNQSYALEQEN